MTSARGNGVSWSLAVACGLGFAGASFAFGYGWPVALLCAVTGAVIAKRIARDSRSKEIALSDDGERKIAKVQVTHPHDASEQLLHDQYPGIDFSAPFFQRLSVLLAPLSHYQRLAFLAFAAQAAISFFLVIFVWLFASAGLLDLTSNMSILNDFAFKVFPVNPANKEAAAMVRLLFLPLVVLYAISTVGLIAAFLLSGPMLAAELKRYWKLILVVLAFIFFVSTFFLPLESHQDASSLKRRVSDGSLLAYLAVYCFIPLLGMVVVHALPNKSKKNASQ